MIVEKGALGGLARGGSGKEPGIGCPTGAVVVPIGFRSAGCFDTGIGAGFIGT